METMSAKNRRTIYLIKRGPKPDYHNAPFHPVVLCDLKRIAEWEAGWTGDRSWVWTHERHHESSGWLLERWEGLEIDYGHVVRGGELPDGTPMAFAHRHRDLGYEPLPDGKFRWLGHAEELQEPWTLLAGAVWWSDSRMPEWIEAAGVVYPPDHFSQQNILDNIADKGGSHVSGMGRLCPDWWPVDPEHPRPDGKASAAWDGFLGGIEARFNHVQENMVITEVGGTHFCQVLSTASPQPSSAPQTPPSQE